MNEVFDMNIRFEKVNQDHQKGIIKIFNYYISNGTAAFPMEPLPESFFQMMLDKAKEYPFYAVLTEQNDVIGFCLLSPYNPFPTFQKTAAITSFIQQDYVGLGIGKRCLTHLEHDARHIGIKHIIAEISSENQQSIDFHKKNGFVECGSLKNIGFKLGREFDVVLMQKDL